MDHCPRHPRCQVTTLFESKPACVGQILTWHPFGWPRLPWRPTHRVFARPLNGDPVEFIGMAWDYLQSNWDSEARWGLYPAEEWALEWPAAPFWVAVRRTRIDHANWHHEPIGPRWRHRNTLDGLPGTLEVTNLATGGTLRSELTVAEWETRTAMEAEADRAKWERACQGVERVQREAQWRADNPLPTRKRRKRIP